MLQITEAAKVELQNKLNSNQPMSMIRLKLSRGCYMKVKLRTEEAAQLDDILINLDDLNFIIDKGQLQYFRGKKLDYLPDVTGFKQFEIV